MKITGVNGWLDGGTIEVIADEKAYCFDRRINTTTEGELFLGYPQKDNSNHIPDPDFALRKALREAIQGFRNPRWEWNCDKSLDFVFGEK